MNDKKVFEYKDKSLMQEVAYIGLCSDGDISCGFKNFIIEELPDSDTLIPKRDLY
jgi:hypothetical protein